MINKIITLRKSVSNASFQPIFEWEDIFKEKLKLQYLYINKPEYLFNKIKGKLLHNNVLKNCENEKSIAFIIDLPSCKYYENKDVAPIFCDVWGNQSRELLSKTYKLDFFFVTSIDIYNLIKEERDNIFYIPLSVSDKWINKSFPEKSIDVVQAGRKNPVLHEYMLRFVMKYPMTEYIYQQYKNKQIHYISTQRGDIGNFGTREKFMELLKHSKISLVSSPGADNSRNTFGIDFITPRFFESAVNYTYMLGRYTNNEESQFLNISSVCDNVSSYLQFETLIQNYLESNIFLKTKEYDTFIENNLTSTRANTINEIII